MATSAKAEPVANPSLANPSLANPTLANPSLISWVGLGLIGFSFFMADANEWSLIPVFVGVWILWRNTHSTGIPLLTSILLAILLGNRGFRLNYLWTTSWGYPSNHLGSIPIDTFSVALIATGIMAGYWLFFAGFQKTVGDDARPLRSISPLLFFHGGGWITWTWVLSLAVFASLACYEILLQQSGLILLELGWHGPLRQGRFLLLAWILGSGLLLVKLWLSLFHRNTPSLGTSLAYLQNILWRETRREQSRSQQWLVRTIQNQQKVR